MDSNIDNAYLGFDPGRDGAMAVIGPHLIPSAVAFDKNVYVNELADLRRQFNLFAVVEHVGAMPGQGVTSCFSFGESFGWTQGVLDAMHILYERVRPHKWKSVFSCMSDKNTSVEVARRLFPEVARRRAPLCRKPHDGKAEALLIAEYARRIRNGQP